MAVWRVAVILVLLSLTYSSCLDLRKHKRRHVTRFKEDVFNQPDTPQLTPYGGDELTDSSYGNPGTILTQPDGETERRKCYWLRCGAGRKCVIDERGEEECICIDEESCPAGHGLVCGSDGVMYESHCMLHRAACLLNKNIFADRLGEACLQRDMIQSKMDPSTNPVHERVASKKKDLSMILTPATTDHSTSGGVISHLDDGCTAELFEEFKDLLQVYHCNRLGMSKCGNQDQSQKQQLVVSMFQYYDQNSDGKLSERELRHSQSVDHLENIAHICSLPHFMTYKNAGVDTSHLDLADFMNAFRIYHLPTLSKSVRYSQNVRMTVVTADGYEGVELTCPLEDAMKISWMRNGHPLHLDTANGFGMMDGGSLYITSVNLEHAGNYSCYYHDNPTEIQHQRLTVHVKPVIRTMAVGKVMEGVATPLRCHSDGVPEPKAAWQVSQYHLPNDSHRYDWTNDNTTVYILSPTSKLDSAKYECLAKSPAGWSVAATEVLVESKAQYSDDFRSLSKGQYVVFHGRGYTSFDAENCFTTHSVDKYASDFVTHISGRADTMTTLDRLCDRDEPCEWGMAVNVRDDLIYVTQPSLSRIVVINVRDNLRPQHVIALEHPARAIYYVSKTDELWILSGQQPQFQDVLILSKASSVGSADLQPLIEHHTVFDAVEQLFVPETNSFNRTSRYLYSRRYDQLGINQIDAVTLNVKDYLDTSNWTCQPISIHYLVIGGLVVIECQSRSGDMINLLADILTNQVISELPAGDIYVSPNTRYIVFTEHPNNMTVHRVTDEGVLEFIYKHSVQISIGHVVYMDSKRSSGYDLAITSSDENSLLFFDLKTKRTEVLEGLLSGRRDTRPTRSVPNLVSASGEFGYNIMTPSQGALFIINKQYHFIACEWTDIIEQQLTLWVTAHH